MNIKHGILNLILLFTTTLLSMQSRSYRLTNLAFNSSPFVTCNRLSHNTPRPITSRNADNSAKKRERNEEWIEKVSMRVLLGAMAIPFLNGLMHGFPVEGFVETIAFSWLTAPVGALAGAGVEKILKRHLDIKQQKNDNQSS